MWWRIVDARRRSDGDRQYATVGVRVELTEQWRAGSCLHVSERDHVVRSAQLHRAATRRQ
jgi:hypothetical protein